VYFEAAGTCVIDANRQLRPTTSQLHKSPSRSPLTSSASWSPRTRSHRSFDRPHRFLHGSSPAQRTAPHSDLAAHARFVQRIDHRIFSDTSGGSAVTSLVIPAGSSTVTGTSATPRPDLPRSSPTTQQPSTVSRRSSKTVRCPHACERRIRAGSERDDRGQRCRRRSPLSVSDQFGNPVTGSAVTLSLDHGSISSDSTETTDATGTATFFGLSITDARHLHDDRVGRRDRLDPVWVFHRRPRRPDHQLHVGCPNKRRGGSATYTPAVTRYVRPAGGITLDSSSSGCTLSAGVVSFTAAGHLCHRRRPGRRRQLEPSSHPPNSSFRVKTCRRSARSAPTSAR